MNTKTKALVESAVMIALAVVLDMVKIWTMPWGGSVTLLSMLPIMLISIRHGIGWGLGSAFCFACLQIITGGVFGWGLTPATLIGALLLDYFVAFTVLGLAGLFRQKGAFGVMVGIVIVCALRFLSHFASGIILWANLEQFVAFGKEWVNRPIFYSLCYNGMYMLPETIFTSVAALLLMNVPQTKKLLLKQA